MSLISVIITTYNWPAALQASLDSLMAQDDKNFEILVADDGSTPSTSELIRHYQNQGIALKHIHHADKGFRAGTIRNKASAQSQGDYLIFIDGDCILFPDFISRHRTLAEANYFVPGNRVLISQNHTKDVLNTQITLHNKSFVYFLKLLLQRKINRITPLLRLPLASLRYKQATKWQKAMTCNLGVWKTDFFNVNGFDELFEGWGYEDSDLVIRLIHAGVCRKEGRFAIPVLHLWHTSNDRTQQETNYQRLMQRLQQADFIKAKKGVAQYLAATP